MLIHNAPDGYKALEFATGVQLECLHGVDRVQAARQILPPGDRRWVVDLYLEGSFSNTHDLKTALMEEYACEKDPDDGEFYCKIREHERSGHPFFHVLWLARLKAVAVRKRQNLDRLLKHPGYSRAFDCQLDMPGLAGGMNLGTLHKMFAMKCEEETLRYLTYVKDTWSRILGADAQAMQKLERHTVKVVELTAPGACSQDAERLYQEVKEGRIFAAFSERERETIWNELLGHSAAAKEGSGRFVGTDRD
ncbi:hypothetical protein T440DRAFT_462707 [Plenodomus tracheiphilus IPT5]|uniref:Uncharacterized protein n=1 Tax=Plenodomus tracheiphilus IPT5 TaxID=1408161 RepID=A0A6A7ANP3_9PLEO|nr:hypothetical protein T440DRAFT_462707 [Plenodomus tracheiphilus IPT5]